MELLILKGKGCHNIVPLLRVSYLFNRHVTRAHSFIHSLFLDAYEVHTEYVFRCPVMTF